MRFSRVLFAVALAAGALPAFAESPQAQAAVLMQSSPLAGFQYYDGAKLWPDMQVGDRLALIREPDNEFDADAVRVEWRGRKLGYVPRAENRRVARQLDSGVALDARISRLQEQKRPKGRVEFEVYLPW